MKIKQFIVYAAGGLLTFSADLALIYLFVKMGVHEDIAIFLGFAISTIVVSFFFHKNITFNQRDRKGVFWKFALASTAVFAVDMGGSIFFKDLLVQYYQSMYPFTILVLVGKTLGASTAGLLHFVFLRNWVFFI